MDFRKELAKELGLGAIAENTMLDDYVKACEAIRYHNCKVKKLNIPDVVGQSEQLVCEHKYQDNVCDWRGVRKCIICGQMEKAN